MMQEAGDEDKDQIKGMLKAQLSHSDGIRGFMVTYLTGNASPADDPTVPAVLQEAMSEVDPRELVPLACESSISKALFEGTESTHLIQTPIFFCV